MPSIEERLLDDISWRESELVNLKTACASSPEGTPKGDSFRRAYLAMLYAHYEGFSKFAWEEYLIEVSRCGFPLSRLKPDLAELFLRSEIMSIKNCQSGMFISELSQIRVRLMDLVGPTYDRIKTSNLWPNILEDTLTTLGVDCDFVDRNRRFLSSLVGRRNNIAHGENIGITDTTLSDLDNAVWDVFFNLTVNIVDACDNKSYKI